MKIILIIFSLNCFSLDIKTNNLSKFTSNLMHELAFLNQLSNKDIDSFNISLSQNSDLRGEFDKFIFKDLLNKNVRGPSDGIIDQKQFEIFQKLISSISDQRLFTKSIYMALKEDYAELLTDSHYHDYLKTKKLNKGVDGPGLRLYINKVNLLYPWVALISQNSIDGFYLKIDEINRSIFANLISYSQVMTRTNPNTKFNKIEFVAIIDLGLEKARVEIDSLNFTISPPKDPSYIPPLELPKEVDDWTPIDSDIIEDGLPLTKDNLFPNPDPSYTPPEVLPTPVDKWQQQ